MPRKPKRLAVGGLLDEDDIVQRIVNQPRMQTGGNPFSILNYLPQQLGGPGQGFANPATVPVGQTANTPLTGTTKNPNRGGVDWKELLKYGGVGALSGMGLGPGMLLQLLMSRKKKDDEDEDEAPAAVPLPAPVQRRRGGPIKAKKAKVPVKMATGGVVKAPSVGRGMGAALRGHTFKGTF